MSRVSRFAVLVGASLVLALDPAGASTVRPMNLEQLTSRAVRIFVGRCAENAELPDGVLGRRATRLGFDVETTLKGEAGPRAHFRRVGPPDAEGAPRELPSGIPRIERGDEVVLFLYGESVIGLSAPVGLGQGRFQVFRGKDGRRYVENDFGNRFLLRGLSAEARERLGELAEAPLPSPLPLETLVEMIRLLDDGTAPSGRGR